jgi:hypothetical protein
LGNPDSTPGDLRGMAADIRATLEAAVISGDPVLAERLIANLVDNAIRYNAAAGDIWISTRTMAGSSQLTVARRRAPDTARDDQPAGRFRRLLDGGGRGGGAAIAVAADVADEAAVNAAAARIAAELGPPSVLVNNVGAGAPNVDIAEMTTQQWDAVAGIGGFFERIFAPRALRSIYEDELRRPDAYAREQYDF